MLLVRSTRRGFFFLRLKKSNCNRLHLITHPNSFSFLPLRSYLETSGLLWVLWHYFSGLSSCCLQFLPAFPKCSKQLTFIPMLYLQIFFNKNLFSYQVLLIFIPCSVFSPEIKTELPLLLKISTYLVCICNTILPGIKDDKFM